MVYVPGGLVADFPCPVSVMSYHHNPPLSPRRRRVSSVEENRHTALETIKATWIQINRILAPLNDPVAVAPGTSSASLPQISKDLQSKDITDKLNDLFEKVIHSLAAAVSRIQLRNSPSPERDFNIRDEETSSLPSLTSLDQVILLEDEVLEYMISENLLLKSLGYATHPHCPEQASLILRWNLLRILETLVSSCLKDPRLLSNESILVPLLGLLDACTATRHTDTDRKMMALMNELVYCLKQAPDLLQFFVEEQNEAAETTPSVRIIRDLRILSYLYPHIHNSSDTGQLARSAVLAVLRILQNDDELSLHVANQSNFCSVLICGLSAFYHSLPQKFFDVLEPGWHRITSQDVFFSSDLLSFTAYVEFCNAAMQLSHPTVQDKITTGFKSLFLDPVIKPALTESGATDLMTALAYFDYIVRTLQDRKLRNSVLDYIVSVTVNGDLIIDHLTILLLHTDAKVAIMAAALFHTLLDTNYEPLLDKLILRHLSKRPHSCLSTQGTTDVWKNLALAEELLDMTPECCRLLDSSLEAYPSVDVAASTGVLKKFLSKKQPEKVNDISQQSTLILPTYATYLLTARHYLRRCKTAFAGRKDHQPCTENVQDASHLNLLQKTSTLWPDLALPSVHGLGPFIVSLLYRLDHFFDQDVFFNLQLTGLISQLLLYPHKAIWVALLGNDNGPELPERPLMQAIMSLKSAVDAILPKSSLGKAILYRAYRSLLLRTNRSDSPSYDPSNILASGNLKQRRHSTSVRPGNLTSEDNLIESIFANGDFMGLEAERNVRRTTTTGIHDVGRLRRAVYPAVLLNEFVQELAAICHERAMASMVDACVD